MTIVWNKECPCYTALVDCRVEILCLGGPDDVRFDAVYCHCEVFVDGHPVCSHMGGFTAFDRNITAYVRTGEKIRISLKIRNNSVADDVSYGTKYAAHPLAGIPRKALVYAVPGCHLTTLGVSTEFGDGDYSRATLKLYIGVTQPASTSLELIVPDGTASRLCNEEIGQRSELAFPVEFPVLWDTEHPNLYELIIKLDLRVCIFFRQSSPPFILRIG